MTKADILKITDRTGLYNFHGHTQFCDGRAPMEQFVEEAIRRGFTDYGFTPHCPFPLESSCNMKLEQVPLYLDEFNRLKAKYGDCINLYCSMEIDYLGEQWGAHSPYFDQLPLDYRLSSVHFIPNQEGEYIEVDGSFEKFRRRVHENFHDDIRFVVDTFYRQSLAMIERGGFDIIGHFDKIGHNAGHYQEGIEQEPWYQAWVEQMIEAIAASGVIAEINTKALADHRRFFPGLQFWKRVKAAGIPLIINSDAHVPALINAGRQEAFELLKDA